MTTPTDAGGNVADAPSGTTWDTKQVVSLVTVILLVVALAGGAVLIGAPDRTAADDPEAYVRSFYEENDVTGLLAALAPGSIPEEQLPQAEQDLGRLLQPGVEVAGVEEHDVGDETVTEVRTSDGLVWCVDPDGTLYVRCRIASAPVTLDAGEVPVEATLSQVDVFPGYVELVLGLIPTGEEAVTFGEDIGLEGVDPEEVQLTQSAAATGGQLAPVQLADFELTQGTTLFLVWRGTQEVVMDRTLTVSWEGGSVDLDVGEVEPLS